MSILHADTATNKVIKAALLEADKIEILLLMHVFFGALQVVYLDRW